MISVSASTSAAGLQSIINSAPAGETILLGPGTFTFDQTVVINRDDITVMGTGSDETTIDLAGSARAGGAFQVGSRLDVPRYSGEYDLAARATEGATSIRLADADGLKAGDHLWIELANTDDYLDAIGDTAWRQDKALRTSMVEVASVDGDTVRLTNGLAFDFTSAATVQRIEVAENVRLGGFSVASGLARQDPGSFDNVSGHYSRSSVVTLSATSDAKLFDIKLDNAPSNGFTVSQSIFLEATNLSVDGAVNKGDGGNGYAFQLKQVYDSTMSGLSAHDTRHAVLFNSWTSEANNTIQVRNTNRDINFHGGDDHHNVVNVLNSIRSETEAGYLSPTLFFNDRGTSYGAPTDPRQNRVTFDTVHGTNKSEVLVAGNGGANLHARAGADTLVGGRSRDQLHAEKGDDTIIGSGGNDTIDGGQGNDVLSYAGDRDDYILGRSAGGKVVVHKPDGSHDVVGGVETFRFADGAVSAGSLGQLPATLFGTDDADRITVASASDIVFAGDGYDRIVSAFTYRLRADAEALELTGTDPVNGYGNEIDNSFTGNDAANQLFGRAGDDRFFARGGDDHVNGGTGDDELYGQAGDDRLFGGEGSDLLHGGGGADTFVFSAGHDSIEDFSLRSGDRIDVGLTGRSASAFLADFRDAARSGGDTYASHGLDVHAGDDGVRIRLADADGNQLALSIKGASLDSLLLSSDWIV